MTDLALAAAWAAVLAAGLLACPVLHRLGLPRTAVRDLLHVGAGVWVLGWPAWGGPLAPSLLAAAAFAGTALVPLAARRAPALRRLRDSLAGDDERWRGLVEYTLAYAVLTPVGLAGDPFPAGAALLALAWGDGVGGAVGLRFGRRAFRAPGAKRKTVEGSLAVAAAAGLGVAVAAWRLGAAPSPGLVLAAGLVAALAEAAAPRGTDNLLVPAAVWGLLAAAGAPPAGGTP